MVDHSDVGAFVGARRAHRVRIQFAPDDNIMTSGRGTFDQRTDIAIRYRGLHEDGPDVLVNQQVDELGNASKTRFGGGRDALYADDIESVGLAEIAERIVRGDDHPTFGRNRGQRRGRVVGEFFQLREIGVRIGAEVRFTPGVRVDQRIADVDDHARPQGRIHPEMRIEAVLIVWGADQQALRHGVGHGDDLLALGQGEKEILQLRLEIETIPENQVGLRHGHDVGTGLSISVRVDARTHQRVHIDQGPAYPRCGVCDHAGGGHHAQFCLGQRRPGGQQDGERRHRGDQSSPAQVQ